MIVNAVYKKFTTMCKYRNIHIAVSPDQLRESLSEATCVMYRAKRANKDWAGPHRSFPYPSGWTNDYERYWLEMLDNYVFTDEYWDCFWKTIKSESCEIEIPMWKQNMQLILPQYVLREVDVLKSQGMILDSKILYTDEKTNEPIYEDEEYDDSY